MKEHFDIVVIGGGINGCGIAADAAMRGLKTLLIEQDDLAAKTSSSSSKLIHGGLRYLEHYHFALVKKALNERQTLLKIAPHLIHPIPLVLPYQAQMRPAWLLRLGLFLYDHLSFKNKLPHTQLIRRQSNQALFAPLTAAYQKGFLFYDCMTDDARLTVSNALQAAEHGAHIMTRTELIAGHAVDNTHWELTLRTHGQKEDAKSFTINTTALINTAGPWVECVNERLGIPNSHHLSLVKGSHILVPKLYAGEQGYLLQNTDARVIFALPYHGYTLIGTTEIKLSAPADSVAISPEEIDYLLQAIKIYFKCTLKPSDVVSSWSGVRPLIEEAENTNAANRPLWKLAAGDEVREDTTRRTRICKQVHDRSSTVSTKQFAPAVEFPKKSNKKPQALSRDYVFHHSNTPAPAIAVYGGKITTYRQLAEDVVNSLLALFPTLAHDQSKNLPLPGSNTPSGLSYEEHMRDLDKKYSWLEPTLRTRLLATYGSRIELILTHGESMDDLGLNFGHGLFQCEVDYLMTHEWAQTPDDILWRRTKLGLSFNAAEKNILARYCHRQLRKTRGS